MEKKEKRKSIKNNNNNDNYNKINIKNDNDKNNNNNDDRRCRDRKDLCIFYNILSNSLRLLRVCEGYLSIYSSIYLSI